ncbi:hypothetical protein [Clostridium sp. ZBS15]|uniref:hypothetical protein n=1 Tax=Clostridium sp. ZBS15 TaxID=2949969 RepID=UPI00207B0032|nr:hypothetical protein [Clostridium sp. ZBS15]
MSCGISRLKICLARASFLIFFVSVKKVLSNVVGLKINEETEITEKTFEYDIHGNIIKEIDNDKNATLFKYDLSNNLIEKKVPVEIVNSDSNESSDNKNSESKIKYQVTSYCYDKNGNKILKKQGIDAIFEDEICNNYNEIYL